MALTLSTAFQNAIGADSGNLAVLFTFDFGTVYGLWTGPGEVVYNSVTYRAGGSLLELPDVSENADGSVEELTLVLNAAPEKGITPDVLAALYDENWHMRPMTIQIAARDPDTGAIVGALTKFRGRIEEAPYIENPFTGEDRIEALCRTWSLDLSLAGDLYRNGQLQRRLDPNDPSLDAVGTLNGAVMSQAKWGQS